MGQKAAKGRWTRRRALGLLAATASVPALPTAAAPEVPPALARICVRATGDPLPARLGAAAGAGRSLPEVAAALRARLGAGGGMTAAVNWRAALVASARRDIARGDVVELLGRPVVRTECEVLALGVILRDQI